MSFPPYPKWKQEEEEWIRRHPLGLLTMEEQMEELERLARAPKPQEKFVWR